METVPGKAGWKAACERQESCDFADGISDVGSWEEGDRSALLHMASCLCHSVTSGSSCLTPDYLEVATKFDLLSMES